MSANVDSPAAHEAASRPSSGSQRRARQQQAMAAVAGRQRRMRLLRWGGVATLALALVGGGYLYFTAAPSARTAAGGGADPRITLVAGQAAPDFSLPTTAGKEVRLAAYRGKQNVLLYFQEGVMCPPCWQQMRDLQSDQSRLDGLNVALLTIAVDPPAQLAQTAAQERVSGMPLLYDQNARVSSLYQTMYTSMMVGQRPGHSFLLIDTAGTIRWRQDFQEMYVPDARILGPVERALKS